MTNLEYMICEAESVGEIDLDTRNNLLSALYESISLQRNQNKMDKKYSGKFKEIFDKIKPMGKDLANAKDKASKPVPGKRKTRADRKKIKAKEQDNREKVKKIEDKIGQLDRQWNNVSKDYKSTSKKYHKDGSNPKESLNQASRVRGALQSNNASTLDHALKKGAEAKNATRAAYYKDDRRDIDKRLDKYGTVESTDIDVDDIRKEIYERELIGEITVEEREQLLDYLDAKLAME